MRLETVTAEIRPRSDWEAVDLGLALARRNFWRGIAVWWLALGLPTAAGAWLLWDRPVLLLAVFWWCKPAGSRMVLFELSRRLFGEEPSWRSVWREIPQAWTRRFFYRFLWARFSPWLPVTLAVEDLEGLRGKAYKQRCGQVVRRGEGVVMWLYFLSDIAAAWLGFGILALFLMLVPEGQDGAWTLAVESWDPNFPMELPLLITRTIVACVMIAIPLADVFVTGAGFGIYINNRTWIEGWDVELAFKRLAQRLAKTAVVMLSFLMIGLSVSGAELRPPAEVIREVKAASEFTVHTVTEKVAKPSTSSFGSWSGQSLKILVMVFGISAVALLVGLLGWVLWKYRHVFTLCGPGKKEEKIVPSARMVMGMEVSPHTLPADVPAAAWVLWQEGRCHESLGLLYRGSISRVMEQGRVEIHESDTEGDCMRRVDQAGAAVHPEYFRGLTDAWIRLAYAGVSPADAEVRALCLRWPFNEGRAL